MPNVSSGLPGGTELGLGECISEQLPGSIGAVGRYDCRGLAVAPLGEEDGLGAGMVEIDFR